MLALRGALLLAFGLVEGGLVLFAFRLPNFTTRRLVIVMAVFVLADGVVALIQASRAPGGRVWLAAQALAGLVAGALMLMEGHPLLVLAWWVLVIGALEAGQMLTSGGGQVLVAALSVALGLWVLVGPVDDPARLLLEAAVYGILAGAVRLRGSRREPSTV
jgi:uncharacterized membrane protein HdeD (DUF308 family)